MTFTTVRTQAELDGTGPAKCKVRSCWVVAEVDELGRDLAVA